MRIPLGATLLLILTSALAAETTTQPSPPFTVSPGRITQLKTCTVIYQSLHIRPTDSETERKTIDDILNKLTAAHVRVLGGPIFIFPRISAAQEMDIDVAIPVPDNTPAPEGCQSRTLDAAPTVTAVYQGPVASMGPAAAGLFQQVRTLQQIPTGELRTRSLYYEDPASTNNIVLLEIPTLAQ